MKKKNTIFGHKNKKRKVQKISETSIVSNYILKKKSISTSLEVQPTIRTKKIDVVIVSINYNDYLILTLEKNRQIFKNITVVTTPEDKLCQKICKKFNVNVVLTDRVFENENTFNKGKAINDGISSIENPDLILLLDADIIVTQKFGLDELNDDFLYTSSRFICFNKFQLDRWERGEISCKEIGKYEEDKGFGFFQLFKYSPELGFPENFGDASISDTVFRDKFVNRKTINSEIIHLGDIKKNWKGRISEPFLQKNEIISLIQRNKKSTFTICSYYFNYKNDIRQKNNFVKFLEQWKEYKDNLYLAIVESENNQNFNFGLDCSKIIFKNLNENNIWSKEILINKVVEEIDTDYILWIDGDLIYEDLNWLANLDEIIGDNDFVQLFENINYLDNDGNILESHKSISSADSNNVDFLLKGGFKPGGSWLGKTSILKKNKLFEKMYVGGGDTIFAYALFSNHSGYTLNQLKKYNSEIYKEAIEWIKNFNNYKVGFLKKDVNHLYHGDLSSRNYNSRYRNLIKFKGDYNLTRLIENDVENESKIDTKSEIIKSGIKKNIAVYTCICGNYDTLKEIKTMEDNIDYICFTDQSDLVSDQWKIIEIPEFLNFFEQTKRARCIKILPHLFLENYETSVWVDANIQILENINELIRQNDGYFIIPKHPDRICVYEEAKKVIELNKDDKSNVYTQIEKYREMGYPENYGLVQSNVIIRKHNDEKCKRISENWWNELKLKSKRDQLSFNFSIYNCDYKIDILNPNIIESKYFQIYSHNNKGSLMVKLRKNYGDLKNYINGKEV